MSSSPNAVSCLREFMIVRSRLLQILGVLVALTGLAGFWLTRDVTRNVLTEPQCQILGMTDDCEAFRASFVVAGRDIFYEEGKSTPVYNNSGRIVAWEYSGQRTVNGTNTDTILYVNIIGNDITVIAIPRDIYLPELDRRINTVYAKYKAEGLTKTVEGIVGLPIEYYAIINTEIFQEFIEALGGVEVSVPYEMHHDDNAANLHIHLEPGLQTLGGEEAMNFIRFRDTPRGDLDRLDNLKSLAYATLAKVKAMNVQAAFKLPELVGVLLENVETNATPALIRQLTTRVSHLQLGQTATLPVFEEGAHLSYDARDVETFIAQTFGGEARPFEAAPELRLLIRNRSGVNGLAERYKDRLEHVGIAEDTVLTLEEDAEPTPSRLLATTESWQDADYFASLLQIGKQQIDHLDYFGSKKIGLELVLGEDAEKSLFANQFVEQDIVVTSAR
jgi:polyisoprenyl-teichoic acid--peptidoglycan teichoic acid transferase